jgi:hypothetical protein
MSIGGFFTMVEIGDVCVVVRGCDELETKSSFGGSLMARDLARGESGTF